MKKVLSAVACAAVIGWAGSASAVSVSYDNSGTVWNTSSVSDFSTLGQDMMGMVFTFNFVGGGSATSTWQSLDSSTSGVSVTQGLTNFKMYMNNLDDTFNGTWTTSDSTGAFSWSAIRSIVIDAGAGDTVFDTILDPVTTPGSARGGAFNVTSMGYGYDINAVYSGQVALNGTVYGDLYRYLTLNFTGHGFGNSYDNGLLNFGKSDFFTFKADTDKLGISGDLAPVPEPTTMLLFGTGLLGLAAFGRRRKA